MKGDFTRGHTPDRKRGQAYRRVLLQQGRVLLDSDIAASVDAQDRQLRELASDVGCKTGSPNFGYVVTPGPLFASFETLDRVSGLPAPGAAFRAYRDHAVKYLGRYPSLYLDATEAAGKVTVAGRMKLTTAAHAKLRMWARIPAGVTLAVVIEGKPTSVPGVGGSSFHPYSIDVQALNLSTYTTIELGFSTTGTANTAWIGLIEGLQPAGAAPAFWFTAGRFYLEGLAVEHGPTEVAWPEATFPSSAGFGTILTWPGTHAFFVAYLEGWERQITAVEDAGILERALGGNLDTTLRTRAMGQVKLALVTTGGIADATQVGNGVAKAFTQVDRGTATLVVTTTPSGSNPDPCAIPTAGGYTGSENRFYRFEVHIAGNIGTARLKWSKDNGSTLHAIGIDVPSSGIVTVRGTSALQDGDLVELLHDAIDLGDEPSGYGKVDLATGTFTPPVRRAGTLYYVETTSTASQVQLLDLTTKNAVSLTAVANKAGLKLRRWSGLCDTAGNKKKFDLGDGITITLDGAGFRVGDYWQYEARRIKDNDNGAGQSSPHGPERLFAPLALLEHNASDQPLVLHRWYEHQYSALCELEADDIAYDGTKAGTTSATVQEAIDELFAKPVVINGCGEIIVQPDDDLQTIFDTIGEGQDARVCIHPGEWHVQETVVVTGKGNLIVSGAGRGTRIIGSNLARVLQFERCASVRVHDLSVQGSSTTTIGGGLEGVLSIVDCPRVELERAYVVAGTGTRRHACGIAVRTEDSEAPSARVRIRSCEVRVGHGQTGILVLDAESADVEDNLVECPEEQWSLDAHIGKDEVAAWAGGIMMSRLAIYGKERIDNEWFVGAPVAFVGDEALKEAGIEPDPWGRPTLVSVLSEWSSGGRATTFSVHPSLDDAAAWMDLLERNPMTGWGGRNRVEHPDGWVLANLRRFRKGLVRAALGLSSPVALGNVGGRFIDLASRLRAQSAVTAGGQGIVVGGRRTPLVGDAFNQRPFNTMYVSAPRAPSVSITGNHVLGFTQGIHVGTSHNARSSDRKRRLRSYRVRVHGNVVHLRVPAIARERHGVFVGNAQSLLVTDNLVELVYPDIHQWDQLPPLDGIRLWGSYGPLLHVRGNHTVGVPTGIRVHALNPHTNAVASWVVVDNAYAGLGQATSRHGL